ncbi:MAG: ribbon-helix-helix domain-containing protein [Candidatus Brockarchaeota archaeon]|nr:ribbon-helix-helix domain-containing protein [Candidatus Brockarchaeota archaeon]
MPKEKIFKYRLPTGLATKELYDAINSVSRETGIPRTEIIRRAIIEYLKNHFNKEVEEEEAIKARGIQK